MVIWRKFEGSAFEYDKHVIRLGGGLYQSYAWGEMKRAADQIPLRLVALEGVEIVATVSVMVRRRYGIVVAWVPGGPAGNLRFFGQEFREALVELTRGAFLYCRLAIEAPSTDEDKETLSHVEWMKPRKIIGSGLTMHYSLLDDEEYRLDRATANWRHNYRRSARHGLTVEQWIEPDIASMENIYREMETLKSLPIQQTKQTLERMVETLGNQLIVYRCLDPNGKLICFRAAALFGNRAWDMLAGATGIARKTYASYATLWALTNHCRKLGAAIYDLSGVDPVHNKGVFDFKSGIGSELVECLGEWEWASHPLLARLANWYIARNL